MKFIALASLLISIDHILLLQKATLVALQQSRSLDFGTILFLLIGLLLNLLGSISWILGRKSVSSYFSLEFISCSSDRIWSINCFDARQRAIYSSKSWRNDIINYVINDYSSKLGLSI